MNDDKPRISCLPDGPYLLKNDSQAPVYLCREKADADSGEPVAGVALCRCGGSSNKPYCDGTHRKNGFAGSRLTDGKLDRQDSYVGKKITILDNRGLCAHAGYCTDNLKAVFRMKQEPWIDPDAASVEQIIELIETCPSGALGYRIDASVNSAPRQARITVLDDGPYAVSGDIELKDQALGQGVSGERYTLCRCGASKNKPFCDGSHWDIGFKDGGD